MLTAGDPVKNARALLRYALPVENKSVRTIQVITPPLYSMHQCRWEGEPTCLNLHQGPCTEQALLFLLFCC